MTNEEIRKCRMLIKDNILHYLTDDWNNHKRGRAHKENQALFDRKEGFAIWTAIDLEMIMEKVVNGIWSADLEQLKEKKMKVKEVANIFDMSVNQLVEISGYSRQGLYDVVEKKCNRNPNRLKSVIEHLQLISMSMYEQDIAEARIQLNNRTKILKQLEEQKND